MSGRFVRSSKFRHVFGRPTKKEQCYDNLRISRNAWDTNLVKANPKYLAVNWEASGGGAFAVIPLEEKGRLPEQLPLFRGHTAVVLDTDWSPFDDSLIASASDDAKAFIWRVPEDFKVRGAEGEELKDVAPIARLTGHSRKLGHVLFNTAAENVLATSSGDYTVKIWDVETGAAKLTLKHGDIIQGLSWSGDGSLLVTTSRDKKLRIWDARQQEPVHAGQGHGGAKASRVVWMGEQDRIATTGFSKMSDRQIALWDMRNATQPMEGFERLDSGSGICMPFWDEGTQCLYLAGKGDGNIRYYEYQNDKLEFLSEYKSADPQRGLAFLPKRGVDVHDTEVMRAFKTVNDAYIEPISFVVPRRAEGFQDDIYPPTVGLKPAVSSADWYAGKHGLPPKIDLAAVYAGEEPLHSPVEHKSQPREPQIEAAAPSKASEPAPAHASVPSSATAAEPPASVLKGPPPSMKDQTAKVKELASKYGDEDEDSSEDDSSFEEISKPIDRSKAAAAPSTSHSNQPTISSQPIPSTKTTQESSKQEVPPSRSASAAGPGPEVQASLAEIKNLLVEQSKTMSAQNATISKLTAEVDRLRAKIGE